MPTFFFDLRTPAGLDPDELGAEFPTLEAAYLDAGRAVVEMSAELLLQRQDPNAYVFEVRDAARRMVLELPFREMLRPGERTDPPRYDAALRTRLASEVERSRKLRSEVREKVAAARATVARARAVLDEQAG